MSPPSPSDDDSSRFEDEEPSPLAPNGLPLLQWQALRFADELLAMGLTLNLFEEDLEAEKAGAKEPGAYLRTVRDLGQEEGLTEEQVALAIQALRPKPAA